MAVNRNVSECRKSGQFILPFKKNRSGQPGYDIYPSFTIGDNLIYQGFESLAEVVSNHKTIIIDGYGGVDYTELRYNLKQCLESLGYSSRWINTEDFLKPKDEILEMKRPFLGGGDPLFGKRTTLDIKDFYHTERLKASIQDTSFDINICSGPGASICEWEGFLIYVDIPKNELQFRARAGCITNLGEDFNPDPGSIYKTFYFVDWIVLNKHKQNIIAKTDVYVDTQHPGMPVWIKGDDLRMALSVMSRNIIRVRPWFEPGVWGGDWIKKHIWGLNNNEPNYAWSFELIVPENGLLIESSDVLLEVSFDCLMYLSGEAVLGKDYNTYGVSFPIRFDFLDTFNGGNLSLQCHPSAGYMKENFGEDFTQEETYYILDAKKDAVVYLGFKEDVVPREFNEELEKSYNNNTPLIPENFILKHPSGKHDLFLIPPGTIHGSGKNNLVLEISSTPYIFTFKMYDWLRPDLNGKPRTLNIKRGMDNLDFSRKGNYVHENLISRPRLIEKGDDWLLYHLPTHKDHLYDIHRYHFKNQITINTNNKCLVLNLVEGESIHIMTEEGICQIFNYAETFIIPASAVSVKITNMSSCEVMLITAFVKPSGHPVS